MRRRFLTALLLALLLTLTAALPIKWNLLYRTDNAASDALYQRTGLNNRDIAVFGIDQETVDALGPAAGLRGVMAQVIENLNQIPEDRPAVIGIDILYTGENMDAPQADRALADAAGRYGNVVVAADARFGRGMTLSENGAFTVQENAVTGWYAPYDALNEAVVSGHINQSLDADGIFRHARLYVDVPEIGRVNSFAKVVYDRWYRARGMEPAPAPETSSDGYYYLPFSSEDRGYDDGFNFLSLVRGEVDPYFYRDKIVLIGPAAPGMQDEYFTSLSHSEKMYGVTIQANMIEAFQKGFFPKELGKTQQLMILFGVLFCLGLFLLDRKVMPSVIMFTGVCAGWVGICALLYRHASVILHVLWVPAGASVLFVGSVAFNYIRVQKEKKLVTNTFGHYIDPVIRDRLLARGTEALELGGETRSVAVLFVDVRGFTSLCEALDAQTVVEILNRYLTLTTDCIMRNHGTLDKFVGDCTMAIWNAPVEQEDAVWLACRAAMDMVEGSRALGADLMRRYGHSVSFGIGVHCGPAVVGNIGAPKRLDYTAIGDTVNTAARLEANAPAGTVLISRAVADTLGSRAEYTSLGDSIHLKGKAEGFEVLRLDRLKPSSGEMARQHKN